MSTLIDLSNTRVNHFMVRHRDGSVPSNKQAKWIVECLRCHRVSSMQSSNIRSRSTRDCRYCDKSKLDFSDYLSIVQKLQSHSIAETARLTGYSRDIVKYAPKYIQTLLESSDTTPAIKVKIIETLFTLDGSNRAGILESVMQYSNAVQTFKYTRDYLILVIDVPNHYYYLKQHHTHHTHRKPL